MPSRRPRAIVPASRSLDRQAWREPSPTPAGIRPRRRRFRKAAAGVVAARLDGRREPAISGLIAAIETGQPAVIATSDAVAAGDGARRATAARLARAAMRVLERARPDLVVVTGGDTAIALLRGLGAERLELVGAPASGLALGHLIVDGGPALTLLTKAGGFGADDLFPTLLKGHA